MFFHMKTTLIIDDGIMLRLKREAATRRSTMSELVETAIRAFLAGRPKGGLRLPDLPAFDGGGTSVDIAERDALYRAMEGR
jgi:hypothetical protein